jgi:hypothetical protein
MIRTFLSAVLLTAFLPAQQVCVRGLVEAAGPSICFAAHTHMFRCGNLKLQSQAIDLRQYQGQVVEACGTVSGQGSCRTMAVASVLTPVDQLVISGTTAFRIARGQIAQFDLGRTPGRFWVTLYSDRTGFTDLGLGVFLLDPARYFPLTQGMLDGTGASMFQLPIPNDPSLVNAWFYFQPAFLELTTLTISMGNSDCFQIS